MRDANEKVNNLFIFCQQTTIAAAYNELFMKYFLFTKLSDNASLTSDQYLVISANSVELVFVPSVTSASASVRSPVVSPPLQQPLVVPGTVNHFRYESDYCYLSWWDF